MVVVEVVVVVVVVIVVVSIAEFRSTIAAIFLKSLLKSATFSSVTIKVLANFTSPFLALSSLPLCVIRLWNN